MSKKLNASMEPFKELMEIQTRMLEKLTRQQIECAQACMHSTLSQTSELKQCSSAEELIDLQKRYTESVEETLRQASKDNLEAFAEAREAIEKISNSAFDAFAEKK
ncbi:MAG: phasin family protein [Motiliproteus sp.]